MTLLDESIAAVAKWEMPRHLSGIPADKRQHLDLVFAAVRESLQTDMAELKRLNTLSAWGIGCGTLLVVTAAAFALSGRVSVSMTSGVVGVFTHAVTLLLFRRVDGLRADIAKQLQFYRHAYGVLLVLDEAAARPDLWKDVAARIARGLGK